MSLWLVVQYRDKRAYREIGVSIIITLCYREGIIF